MLNRKDPSTDDAAALAPDVLVIGGGPAGSTAATLLARCALRGWRERRRRVGSGFSGDTLHEGNP